MDYVCHPDCTLRGGNGRFVRLDPVSRHLVGSDGVVKLTGREASVLHLLARGGGPYSREFIYRKVFGRDWCPTDRSLDVHVAHLRSKLRSVGLPPPLIESIRSRGYQLCAEVCIVKTSA